MKKINIYKKTLQRITSLIFAVLLFVILPVFTQPVNAVWTGGQCNLDGQSIYNCCNNQSHVITRTGWTDTFSAGHCIDVNDTACPDGRVVPSNIWLCPGGNNIRCCVPIKQPPPTSVTASCSPTANVTVNWTLPSGYTYAYPRIYDETSGATCYPGPMTGNSYSCQGTYGHQYTYWVHTTNAGGSPYSNEVPTVRTSPRVTCQLPVCPSDPTPIGTVISNGVAVSASSVLNNDTANYGPANAVDGQLDLDHYWNSGTANTGWIELNLGAPQTVTGLRLYVRQSPNGVTTTQIKTGSTPNPAAVQRTLNCTTNNNQIINISFPAPLTNVQYIRVNTTSSPSQVAWNEISVYGSAPGSQTTTPGIIFSGNGSATFGQGSASVTNWTVGGLTYPEVFKINRAIDEYGNLKPQTTSLTSYQYILNKAAAAQVAITDLPIQGSTCSSLSNCTLPSNLQNGVYRANGNVTLNSFAFLPNKNFVLLINGDLTIMGNIIVPNGSTAFFSASHDIIVDKSVGTATNLFPLPAGQIQGIFSADRDFRIEGINDCLVGKDKMLNVEGAIVTNASGNGGNFRSQRDLCGDNPRYPTLTVRGRLDMILNLPELVMQRVTTFREDAP